MDDRSDDRSTDHGHGDESREAWVPRERVVKALVRADPALRDALAEAQPDTVDEM